MIKEEMLPKLASWGLESQRPTCKWAWYLGLNHVSHPETFLGRIFFIAPFVQIAFQLEDSSGNL